ncbi:MAG: DUF6241 domain-containing protein [Clostridiaceae bacterium]|nr:DUF6241 domain-containing protein [Clostridiaceae bacterium]
MKKRLLIGGIITVIIVGVGLAYYFTITNNIKKENALKIVQLNKQKADEKKANDKKLADEKALAEAKAIEDAKAQVIADAKMAKEQAIADAQALADLKIIEEERVYIKMHEMINSKIISKDGLYYGVQNITSMDCDQLLQIIKDNNFSDGAKLTLYLNSWKKKDFSNGVAQHNYIWDKLGRGEGEAIALR